MQKAPREERGGALHTRGSETGFTPARNHLSHRSWQVLGASASPVKQMEKESNSPLVALRGSPQGQAGMALALGGFSEQSTGLELSASGGKSFPVKLPLIRPRTLPPLGSGDQPASRRK